MKPRNDTLILGGKQSKKYTINLKTILGEGAFAIVYTGALSDASHTPIAIKQSKDRLKLAPKMRPLETCQKEATIEEFITEKKQTNSPQDIEDAKHLVDYYGAVTSKSFPMVNYQCIRLAFEFCDRGTLENWMFSDQFNFDSAYTYLNHVARGLRYLHNTINIVHNDLKAPNIFLKTNDNGTIDAKLGDRGLAQKISANMEFSGSPLYSAPEVLARQEFPSPASDIYSYGLLTGEIINGQPIHSISVVNEKSGKVSFIGVFKSFDELLNHVYSGQRESLAEVDAPPKLTLLAKWCWFGETGTHRPTTSRLCEITSTSINEGVDELQKEFAKAQNDYKKTYKI